MCPPLERLAGAAGLLCRSSTGLSAMDTSRRHLIAALGLLVGTPTSLAAWTSQGIKRRFFVDPEGHDESDGRSPERSWATLARASAEPFRPGDAILLKRGALFPGGLVLSAGGTREQPIVVSAYGRGERPLIWGARSPRQWVWDGAAWKGQMSSMPGAVLENLRPMTWRRDAPIDGGPRPGEFVSIPNEQSVLVAPSRGNVRDHEYLVAQTRHGITGRNVDNVIINGVSIGGFARHGILVTNGRGWIVDGNRIFLIGGYWEPENGFLGNGVEFSADCIDCAAINNDVSDIFDSGLTAQTYLNGSGSPMGIVFSGNRIARCGMAGVEIALYHPQSSLRDVFVLRNSIKDSGRGWAGIGDPTDRATGGYGIIVMSVPGRTAVRNVQIRNNTITGCLKEGLYSDGLDGVLVNEDNIVLR